MEDVVWISKTLLLAIHRRQLAEFGKLEGIRDEAMLESALARPQHLAFYSKDASGIAALAAAYAFGISQNHPFLDGNKRTAAVACETFIELNGYTLAAEDEPMYRIFVELAEGVVTQKQLAQWINEHLRKED